MNQIIMWVMAAGAIAGGLDRIFKNRFGLGEKFEEGFMALGPTALSMAGIVCLVPVFSGILTRFVVPAYSALGFDPAIFGGLLAIDMGGYQLAVSLAGDSTFGAYAGILVSAIFGCTVSFTIPIGMGILQQEDRPLFAKGILFGMIAMPAALFAGGLLCGLTPPEILKQNLFLILLSIGLLAGIIRVPEKMIHGFSIFAEGIRILTTIGLMAGAFSYMTGISIGLTPVEEAMKIVSSIGIVMLGSLPISEILQRLFKTPLQWFGDKTGMNSVSIAGLFIGTVSVLPAIAMMKDMDRRGKIVNAAFVVSTASLLAAHLGFTAGVQQEIIGTLIITKLTGGVLGAVMALACTHSMYSSEETCQ
ncbi:MAG: ethanolamine utilization protein EutH [Lachnospiraceae bacterium]